MDKNDNIKGTKYQKYVDDELVILRLIAIENDKYYMADKKNKTVVITEDEFNLMIKLQPDAMLTIFHTISEEDTDDIFVCVSKLYDMMRGSVKPALVLRQDIYSTSKNIVNNMDVFVGDCYNTTYLSEEDFANVFKFSKIEDSEAFALYIDDKIDDILKVISKSVSKFNKVLKDISKSKTDTNLLGYCDNINDLIKTNNFMTIYRQIFNIVSLDFPIDIKTNRSKDADIILNSKQQRMLEDELQCYITDIIVLKYDKDIDISNLITRTHIMVSDNYDDIYLISYVITSRYEIDEDIKNAMLK